MEQIILGRTGLKVSRTGFGALPIQRIDFDSAKALLLRAYESGINFFDTARGYSDSEEKMGYALKDVRKNIIIATKCTGATNKKEVLSLLETSLKNLKTDYVDILQLHNPAEIPDPNDPESTYAGLLEAKQKGMIRFIGMTNHTRETAKKAVLSGLFDTLQFPLSAISSDEDFKLPGLCLENNIGFIAMKAMCGGILSNSKTAFAGLRPYDNVLPIWGVQKIEELEEFIALEKNPPVMDDSIKEAIAQDKKDLSGGFCRACGYCLPCPADIPIPMAARMGLLLRRMPSEQFRSPEWQEKMSRIDNCINCGACASRCPYGLDTPNLLKEHLAVYRTFLEN